MASTVKSVESLRESFWFFAATQCRGRSAVYEMLSEDVAGDDPLLDLLVATPEVQRRPSLLFAAVNHGSRRPVDENLMPAFSAFCARHHTRCTTFW